MKRTGIYLAALVAVALGIMPAQAQETDHLSLSMGYYDIGDDDEAADFRAEYRWGNELFWKISPYTGLEVTSEGSVWAGAGLYANLFLNDNIYLTPSFGAGLYDSGGADLDLGYPLQFRSQIELGYDFGNSHRLSVGYGHISNASLDEDNPGTEILNLYYHVPVSWF